MDNVTDGQAMYHVGMKVRREVLGDAYVDAALTRGSEFNEPLQQLVTEYCWGATWSRPGLSRKTRSLLNLGMLTAMGKMEELATHVRGALNNGCSVDEIREALLQTAVYCGVPAAINAFRAARTVLEDEGAI